MKMTATILKNPDRSDVYRLTDGYVGANWQHLTFVVVAAPLTKMVGDTNKQL